MGSVMFSLSDSHPVKVARCSPAILISSGSLAAKHSLDASSSYMGDMAKLPIQTEISESLTSSHSGCSGRGGSGNGGGGNGGGNAGGNGEGGGDHHGACHLGQHGIAVGDG